MRANIFTILFFTSYFGFSQINTPQPSPSSELEQMVGLSEIEVEYNRPSKRGRVIFGNLVPFGKLWRTGANTSTKISFSTDVELAGNTIKEGTYSIFSVPNENNWDIILYSDADYKAIVILTHNNNDDNNNIVYEYLSIHLYVYLLKTPTALHRRPPTIDSRL